MAGGNDRCDVVLVLGLLHEPECLISDGPATAFRQAEYEALQDAAERQHAVAAALASVRAEGLEPSAEDLVLFAEVAAGRLSTDELRERVLARYRR